MFIIICFYSYKPDRSDDIHGWRGFRGYDPLPIRRYLEIYHQKRATHGENSLGVHIECIPGKRLSISTRFPTVDRIIMEYLFIISD